ncbi:hypothetical protein C7212DRAFT_340962 [Tuber magnatum]|uniref:Uncharacterized protein n=1 Tax=Tuber magnatum TaxID=42249 RepID=A0A317T2A6_9PEZI|nr:hypothetical protein C7212DRAFT_340962 [Tuber magnatum]
MTLANHQKGREVTPRRQAAIITMRELDYQFKDIKMRTGIAISTASDIHRHKMENAIAKCKATLPNTARKAELEEVWKSDGFGLFRENEWLSADEINQVGWRREMRSRDKDKILLHELLSKDCLDKKPRSGRPKALTDMEINCLVLTVKRDFRMRRMCLVNIRRESGLSRVSDSTI